MELTLLNEKETTGKHDIKRETDSVSVNDILKRRS